MTSFDHVMISTRNNWFQTNPMEHESDDHAGNTVSSVCVINGKHMTLQQQISSGVSHSGVSSSRGVSHSGVS